MRKILAVTGIRSDYDIMFPVLKELKNNNYEVNLVITGAHLSDWHGDSLQRVEQDGFKVVDKIDYLLSTNRLTQRSKGVGLLISGLTQTVEREKPDFLLFLGDREEALATSVVGNYMNILTIHLAAGDSVWGNADDPIRHSASRLSHILVAFAENYAQNLIKQKEEPFRILCSGNPSYVNIANEPEISLKEISSAINFDVENNPYIIMIKHPLSSEYESAYSQMKCALAGVGKFAEENNVKVINIYPNTDPGAYDILRAINECKNENILFYKTLPRNIFINLVRRALCLTGNSSMGIVEAPFYKLPVVNIGHRQRGRLNAGNVEFVDYDIDKISVALKKACFDEDYRKHVRALLNPYGDETAAKKIVEFIDKVDLADRKWYVKKLVE